VRGREDTIAAVATAHSPAALGIVRISGPDAEKVLLRVMGRKRPLSDRRVSAGIARDPETFLPIDEVIVFFCKGPKTATGEDTAEIQGHGGPLVMKRLLEAALKAGARPAEPGEFTYRAFANNRIDLTQAEAVMGLIGARSERAARICVGQLSGNLGRALSALFEEISSIAAHVEAGLDFPDEDLPVASVQRLGERLSDARRKLDDLAASFSFGARLGDGARIAVIGPPNAGKSSLFNRLVKEDRAIVDDMPGTTRDVVEYTGEISGVPVVYADTAGVRDTDETVEKNGVERSMRVAASSDLLLLVLDGAAPSFDVARISSVISAAPSAAKLVALNKRDLPAYRLDLPDELKDFPLVSISAATGEGMDALDASLAKLLDAEDRGESLVLTTSRQHRAVSDAAARAARAAELLMQNGELELAAAELKWAGESLAALLGKSADDEMLSFMFSQFCIGK
jgi:tRNA modification GTPase